MLTSRSHAHPLRRSLPRAWPRLPWPVGWKSAGALALLCSTVAWASLPHSAPLGGDEQREWRALGIAPLSSGGEAAGAMAQTDAAEPIAFAPVRAPDSQPAARPPSFGPGPIRVRGVAGDGLYWSLRAAGVSPQSAADYLAALATEIDVGEVAPNDTFDLVLGSDRSLLYAGLGRGGQPALELVKWSANGRSQWIDAANVGRPAPAESSGFIMPAQGPVTSYFGYRYHPILHFTRFHAGIDIGAGWGSPIVAAADGRVAVAGWAGGYGREVQIAHGGGVVSLYGHMSEIVASPGSYVRAGQVIGYVGSSGLSTGPHVHFEVRENGTPVNPLSVRLTSAPTVDPHLAGAVRARLQALLSVAVARPSGRISA